MLARRLTAPRARRAPCRAGRQLEAGDAHALRPAASIVGGSDAVAEPVRRTEGSDLVIVSVDTLAGDRDVRAGCRSRSSSPTTWSSSTRPTSSPRTASRPLGRARPTATGSPRRWRASSSDDRAVAACLERPPPAAADGDAAHGQGLSLLRPLAAAGAGGLRDRWTRSTAYPPERRRRHFIRRTKEEMVHFDGRRIYPERVSDTLRLRAQPGATSEQTSTTRPPSYIRTYYNRARILNRSAARLAMSVFQRRLASSTWALLRSFERRSRSSSTDRGDPVTAGSARPSSQAAQRRLARTIPTTSTRRPPTRRQGEENEAAEDRALGGVGARSRSPSFRRSGSRLAGSPTWPGRCDAKGDGVEVRQARRRSSGTRGSRTRSSSSSPSTATRSISSCAGSRASGSPGRSPQIHGGMAREYADGARPRQDKSNSSAGRWTQGGATYMVCTDAAGGGHQPPVLLADGELRHPLEPGSPGAAHGPHPPLRPEARPGASSSTSSARRRRARAGCSRRCSTSSRGSAKSWATTRSSTSSAGSSTARASPHTWRICTGQAPRTPRRTSTPGRRRSTCRSSSAKNGNGTATAAR